MHGTTKFSTAVLNLVQLYTRSAMVWGGHWEQRLGVKLAQGEASLVLGAVATARANAEGSSGRKASPEWSSTDCKPSDNL
jgi:hypothetical protein